MARGKGPRLRKPSFADRLVIMQHGKIVADGLPAAVVSEAETFDVRSPSAAQRGGGGLSWLI